MKTIKITLLLMLLSCISYGQIAKDKQLHFIAGAAVSAVTYVTVLEITKNTKKAYWYSKLAALAVGFGKELIDEGKYNGFDAKDLGYTALGGATMSFSLNLFHKSQKKMLY